MITLDWKPVKIDSYPDGTILMRPEESFVSLPHMFRTLSSERARIEWRYENDREYLALIYLVKHLRSLGYRNINLYMPYIPNARMDRVKNREDVFTLKYFAELLNNLNLDSVTVLDPHSSVSIGLINNIKVKTAESYITKALTKINPHNATKFLMFYPDNGAAVRYSYMFPLPYAYGIKKRNWETGQIEGLDVAGAVDQIAGKDILIVDDICSRGGTFYHSAKKLKELGANDIYLYVSHCENTILEGELLKGDLIKKVFTTDSIFTKSHEKVEVLK